MDTRTIDRATPSPSAIIAYTDAKTYLGITDTSQDALLTRYCSVATETLEAYTDNVLLGSVVTETLYPENPPGTVVLSYSKILTFTSIVIDGGSAEDLTNYIVDKKHGMIRRVDGANWSGTKFVFTYTAGYSSIPTTLFEAALEFVRDMYNSKSRNTDVSRENVPDVADVQYSQGAGDVMKNGATVSFMVAGLLAPYVRQVTP